MNTNPITHNPMYPQLGTPGSLNLTLSLSLHTLQARKLVTGIPTKRGMIGLWSFTKGVKKIWEAAGQDDPYADWQLLKIYDALKNADRYLRSQLTTWRQTLRQTTHFTINNMGSVTPIRVPLYFVTPYGYWAADMIGIFDELARELFTAKTIGMKSANDFNQAIRQAMHQVLKSFNKAYQWKALSLTRADVIAKSNNALTAERVLGPLPEVILLKKLRAPLAPIINKTRSETQVKESKCSDIE